MSGTEGKQVKSWKAQIVQERFTAQIAFVQRREMSLVQANFGNCRWCKQRCR